VEIDKYYLDKVLIKTEIEHRKNLSKKTKEKYYKWNVELLECSEKNIDKITIEDVKKYLKTKKCSEISLKNILSGIKWILEIIHGKEFGKELKKIKIEKKEKSELESEKIEVYIKKKISEMDIEDIKKYLNYIKEKESFARIRHIMYALISEIGYKKEIMKLLKEVKNGENTCD